MPSSETFCTIMSMLTASSASAVKIRAAMPGLSGTRLTTSLPSPRSWATPEMITSSTDSSFARTHVPSR